jgi:hypothetical protein
MLEIVLNIQKELEKLTLTLTTNPIRVPPWAAGQREGGRI